MKKRLCSLALVAALLVPTVIAKAESGTWYFFRSGTKITGTLYLYGSSNEAQAKTVNNSNNGVKVLVKLYATQNGVTDQGSWREARDYESVWTSSTSNNPDWWGSIHSTTPTSDPYECLSLYAH